MTPYEEPSNLAERVVNTVFQDLTDRRGIKHAISEVDAAVMEHELLPELTKKVAEVLLERDQEVQRLTDLINTPELIDFGKAVVLEAAHQRERWGAGHDTTKTDEDWLWLIGYLTTKAMINPIIKEYTNAQRYIEQHDTVEFGLSKAEVIEKQLHHIITIAAAAANWHAAILKKR